MTLAKRIIPCLDVDNGRVVKGVNFINIVDAGDPKEVAKRYDLDVLTKEEKLIKKFPLLSKRINKLEDEIAKIKVEQVKLRGKK